MSFLFDMDILWILSWISYIYYKHARQKCHEERGVKESGLTQAVLNSWPFIIILFSTTWKGVRCPQKQICPNEGKQMGRTESDETAKRAGKCSKQKTERAQDEYSELGWKGSLVIKESVTGFSAQGFSALLRHSQTRDRIQATTNYTQYTAVMFKM